ncbi:hypothetical protein KKG29_03115 [Patescibacteria group bacterium]|nr:hypothetical protein [Patescibacteria group bacterium]MBU4000137.1 hypothetical protein [Patescibacteria group bacterium]MBU4056611.1 hypothetical protein [Patescibacteria group bacterium]MBU4368637.1 hypothetical protein [Patescibacteria group bacterium]
MDKEMPKPINIFVKFDPILELITGQTEMKIVMSEGASFIFLIQSIFTSYPEIPKRYQPGRLAMILNNRRPTEYEFLHDGDRIIFQAVDGS